MNSAAKPFPDKMTKGDLQLKVCGMRQQQNIEAILAFKPDYLGFIFYPKSSRYVGAALSEDIINMIPESTKKVGVFVNDSLVNIQNFVQKYKLEAVQLHGEEPPELCRDLKESGIIILKAFSLDDAFDFKKLVPYEGFCDYFLFDTKGKEYGGNGVCFNWEILQHYHGQTPFFLSGGIDLPHAEQIKSLHLPLLRGIDINSRFEISPALKDSNKVRDFFNQIRDNK